MAQVLELLPVVWEIREFPDSWLQSCPDFTVQVLSALQNNKFKKKTLISAFLLVFRTQLLKTCKIISVAQIMCVLVKAVLHNVHEILSNQHPHSIEGQKVKRGKQNLQYATNQELRSEVEFLTSCTDPRQWPWYLWVASQDAFSESARQAWLIFP